ncbi:MAG: hypothetical protein PUJ55_04195 [Clostridiales bacterium]|nr:hypothetical protein [Roseburia sp.]MDD7636124.1 hypothetical protein [Clostridiales bacterium]MDY4112243.1 hypothetical protein [Roseburia sp.]
MTHLAIALCNYCASKQKKKCAYLELHARNEISQLVPEAKLLSSSPKNLNTVVLPGVQNRPRIRLCGVDYYPAVTASEVPALLNHGYDYLILDVGTPDEGMLSEFLRCDRKLILGSLAPWKSWKYEALFQKFTDDINLGEGFDYLVQTGSTKELASFSKTHHIKMQVVPFIKNPFHIEKELFPFLGTLSTEP